MCPTADDPTVLDGPDDANDDTGPIDETDDTAPIGEALEPRSARHALVETTLGTLTVVTDGTAVTGIYFDGHAHRPDVSTFGPEVVADQDAVLGLAERQLDEYLDGERTEFELPLATDGNEFQERVWDRLRAIPYGETVTYGQIAADLGDVTLAQAVGNAVGRNPISIVVPCHRVVGSTGKLTGYAGGLERKTALLDLEEPPEARAQRLF